MSGFKDAFSAQPFGTDLLDREEAREASKGGEAGVEQEQGQGSGREKDGKEQGVAKSQKDWVLPIISGLLGLLFGGLIAGISVWAVMLHQGLANYTVQLNLANLNRQDQNFRVLINNGQQGKTTIIDTRAGYEVKVTEVRETPTLIEIDILSPNRTGMQVTSLLITNEKDGKQFYNDDSLVVNDEEGLPVEENIMQGTGVFFIYFSSIGAANRI